MKDWLSTEPKVVFSLSVSEKKFKKYCQMQTTLEYTLAGGKVDLLHCMDSLEFSESVSVHSLLCYLCIALYLHF